MKKSILKITLTAVAFVCLGLAVVNAQSHKFGYVDFQDLMQQMPEYKKANTDMESFGKQLEDELKRMSSELEKKADEYQKQESKMAEAIKEMKQKELQDMQTRIQQFQQSAQQNVRKKEEELLRPIIEKAKKAISDVAKEGGLSYVFDTSPGSPVLYKPEGDNIMSLVFKKLGISNDKPAAPAAPQPKK